MRVKNDYVLSQLLLSPPVVSLVSSRLKRGTAPVCNSIEHYGSVLTE
jgi:hypothetical protein